MPVFNLTIDDKSPLIQYSPGWSDSPHTDAYFSDYVNETFHETASFGASASLTFNGSALYLYGAFRPNHDFYSATIDGNTTTANGFSNVNLFNQLMYSTEGLQSTEHQFVLQNKYTAAGQWFVDVDYIVITAGDGDASTQSNDIVLDDGAANITYSPASAWDTSPNGLEDNYFNHTMHRTNAANAAATISFYGNAITVFGATSGNHGPFSVQLDGGVPVTLNGSSPVLRYQNMLYWAGGLSPTDLHNLTLANTDINKNFFDLDKFVVSRWPTVDTSFTTGSSADPVPTNSNIADGAKHRPSPLGVVVGCAVAVVIVLVAAAVGAYYYFRRRRRNIDRIQTGGMSKEDVIAGGTMGTIEPFRYEAGSTSPAAGPMADVTGRTSLSPQTTFPPASSTVLSPIIIPTPSSSYPTASASAKSPEVMTDAPPAGENPHRDFPPPAYDEATAGRNSF